MSGLWLPGNNNGRLEDPHTICTWWLWLWLQGKSKSVRRYARGETQSLLFRNKCSVCMCFIEYWKLWSSFSHEYGNHSWTCFTWADIAFFLGDSKSQSLHWFMIFLCNTLTCMLKAPLKSLKWSQNSHLCLTPSCSNFTCFFRSSIFTILKSQCLHSTIVFSRTKSDCCFKNISCKNFTEKPQTYMLYLLLKRKKNHKSVRRIKNTLVNCAW